MLERHDQAKKSIKSIGGKQKYSIAFQRVGQDQHTNNLPQQRAILKRILTRLCDLYKF